MKVFLLQNLRQNFFRQILHIENRLGEQLLQYHQMAVDDHLPAHVVKDAGKTVVASGTLTCVGIGPASSGQIDRVTGRLKDSAAKWKR